MSQGIQPDQVGIKQDAAVSSKTRTDATVSRADADTLGDDPEAKARFLATFDAVEEKRIMRKVDRHFFLLIGLMYMIKSVRRNLTGAVPA